MSGYVRQCAPGVASAPLKGAWLIWGALASLALVWMSLIVAAPLALDAGHDSLAHVIYQAFSPLCHQIFERSFHLEGHKLAVCSRCTGIYAGFAVAVWVYPLVRSLRNVSSPSRLWLILAALPITVDFALGLFGLWPNTHLTRFTTGALLGAVCAIFVVPGLLDVAQAIRRRFSAGKTTERRVLQASTHVSPEHTVPTDYSRPARRI
jgi:uncharacterized membrane protein